MKNGDGAGACMLSGVFRENFMECGQPCDLGQKCWRGVSHVFIWEEYDISQREQHTQDAEVSFGMCGWCSDNMRKGVGEGLQEVIKADDSSVTYHWLVTSYLPGLVGSILDETLQGKCHFPTV